MKLLALRVGLVAFAAIETALVVYSNAGAFAGSSHGNAPYAVLFVNYSVPLSLIGWSLFGVTFLRRRQPSNIFTSRGFDEDVYNLMVKMRGATSRLALLRNMETPRHRNELSELTGIDWKEVDRELSVLEKYGLVRVYAESGTVKMYQLTEQGKVLIQLMDELKAR